jgi:tRNA pseudouridine55 synthase
VIAIPAPNNETGTDKDEPRSAPLHLVEGILAVDKPIDWTSQDVVSYIRRIIERDARDRGANPAKMGRKNKSQQIKVGHGGTLDPLATGVLVVGVGRGTKELSKYLHGSKAYRATGRFGIETTTLDLDPKANITQTKPWDHVSFDKIDETLPKFVGKIQQIPPVFSAKRQGGKKAYEIAREEGVDSVKMEAREVEIYRLKLLRAEPQQQQGVGGESSTGQVDDAPSASTKSSKPTLDPISSELPDFTIEMECGGGTFVRSLIRDVAYELDTVATTALLQRTKQGPFVLDDCLPKDDWTAENIYEQIRNWNDKLKDDEEEDGTIEQ